MTPAEAPDGQVLVAELADETVRYRMFTGPPEGATFEITYVVEQAWKDRVQGGRGRSVGPLTLPLEVNDGLATNTYGRIAQGIAPVDAARVDLVADENVVASATPYQHPDLGASFFLTRVAHAAPSLDGAVAYDANEAVVATSGYAHTTSGTNRSD